MNKRKLGLDKAPAKTWVSASSTRNWMLRDPLLDWLKMYKSPGMKTPEIIKKDEKPKRKRAKAKAKGDLQLSTKSLRIHDFILEQGNKFEEAVLKDLQEDFPDDIIQIAYSQTDILMESKADETFAAMQEGYPFIYQGVLHDVATRTFGSPDLLVRSDYLECLVDICPLTEEQWSEGAPELADADEDESDGENIPPYHYTVVDIKYSTLKLRSDGVHLLNSGNLPAYKAQLYIYHRALSTLQGFEPLHAYILGRNWEYTKKNQKHRGRGCFEKLGVIDYTDDKLDKPIIKRTNDAVDWLHRLREEGKSWELYPLPSVPELYPNMSNRFDSPWHTVKKEIAGKIGEITSIWYCGVKHRKRAHKEGVMKWTNPECTAELMGFKKRKKDEDPPRLGDTIDEILDINRQDEDAIRPAYIENNYRNWQGLDGQPAPIELYVDFETVHSAAASHAAASVDGTVNSIFGRPRSLPNHSVANGDMIFIIGCGWYEVDDDSNEQSWQYESFVAESLTFAAEKKVLQNFYDRVQEIVSGEVEQRKEANPGWWASLTNGLKSIARAFRRGDATLEEVEDQKLHVNIYHWGHIEPKTFERACERHPHESFNSKLIHENWVDFYKVMKSEPIVVRGALSFGLKHIVRSMHKSGLIDLQWQTDGCTSGIEAMAQAVQIYRDYSGSGLPILSSEKMNSIVAYNEIDCRAVYYIINYLRTEHSGEPDEKEEEYQPRRNRRRSIIMLDSGSDSDSWSG